MPKKKTARPKRCLVQIDQATHQAILIEAAKRFVRPGRLADQLLRERLVEVAPAAEVAT